MRKIILNGRSVTFEDNKVDNIYSTNEIQPSHQDHGTTNISEPTELGETLKEAFYDKVDPVTRTSAIDLRANLDPYEARSILALDALVALGVLTKKVLPFSIQKKRLSVSVRARGRNDIVNIVSGKRDQDSNIGGVNKVKNFFGMGGQKSGVGGQ